MKIVINCRPFLKKQATGIGRYAYHLVQSLGQVDTENEYCLYVPKRLFDRKRKSPEIDYKNFIVKKDFWKRGVEKVAGQFDVYHAPSPEDLPSLKKAKTIVTIHDIIFKTYPQGHTEKTIRTMERQIKNIVRFADKIICISKSTRDDLVRFYDVRPDKLALIHHGVDADIFFPVEGAEVGEAREYLRRQGLGDDYILFVGTIEPRKNLNTLLRAVKILKDRKHLRGKLVVVGMKGWLTEGVGPLIDQLGLKQDIIFMGYVSGRQLRHLYNGAGVFVFPSFYEGFGFPILEAFSCGAPVVTSKTTSCAEIAHDAALTVEPSSQEEIALAIQALLSDREKRAALREKGFQRAREFTFEKTARQTLDVYQETHHS